MRALEAGDLHEAEAGSYYTILGTGGPLLEWVVGYEAALRDWGVGTPQEWFTTTGAEINLYASRVKRAAIHPKDCFAPDLSVLLFPLDGLNVSALAALRLQLKDRWFDDIVQNMRALRA